MGVIGCWIGLQPDRFANIVAQGNGPPALARGFHTNFRMEKFDEHQNLRLLWPVFPARPTRQKPHLLFSNGLSERTTQAVATNQNEDGPRLP